jgi:intraflagellar transport protein 52
MKCVVNKEDIKYEKIKSTSAVVFMAPTKKFNMIEFNSLKKYIDEGSTVIMFSGEGGELKSGTNFNHLLEQYGIFINDDAVIRTSYFKYFNPKEVLIQNGVVDEEFIRVAKNKPKKTGGI